MEYAIVFFKQGVEIQEEMMLVQGLNCTCTRGFEEKSTSTFDFRVFLLQNMMEKNRWSP